jgi:hypothetical protein
MKMATLINRQAEKMVYSEELKREIPEGWEVKELET